MKRWWIVLAGGSVLALLLALLSTRNDGLDWIRAYGGREEQSVRRAQHSDDYYIERWFTYKTVPKGLEADLIRRAESSKTIPGWVDAMLTDGWRVDFVASERSLYVYRYVQPNWLEKRWDALKRFVGVQDSSSPIPWSDWER